MPFSKSTAVGTICHRNSLAAERCRCVVGTMRTQEEKGSMLRVLGVSGYRQVISHLAVAPLPPPVASLRYRLGYVNWFHSKALWSYHLPWVQLFGSTVSVPFGGIWPEWKLWSLSLLNCKDERALETVLSYLLWGGIGVPRKGRGSVYTIRGRALV